MKPVADWTDAELHNLIANYRRNGKTDDAYYLALLEENGRRKGQGFDFNKTLRAVLKAARGRRFLSYKQLADESGLDWAKVRYAASGHLGDLIEYAHRRGWPLLSAIVVNQKNLDTGEMDPSTLRGFAAAAKGLGFSITDERAFLTDQQAKVFEWAESQERVDGNP